jgi:hypothetical protein
VKQIEEMTGSIAIEFGNQMYVKALDNGLFTLGAPHSEGQSNNHHNEIIRKQWVCCGKSVCAWTCPGFFPKSV